MAIFGWLSELFHYYKEDFFRDITTLGGFIFYILLSLLVLSFQEWLLFSQLVFGLLFTGAVVVLVRSFYFKDRPKKQKYNSYIERLDASSFPSWHSARIFVLAFILSAFFAWEFFVALAFFFVALLTAYSRIYLGKHDFFDISAGFLLAALTFYLSSFLTLLFVFA